MTSTLNFYFWEELFICIAMLDPRFLKKRFSCKHFKVQMSDLTLARSGFLCIIIILKMQSSQFASKKSLFFLVLGKKFPRYT